MKRLSSIIYCIISFGFGFIFGYFVSGYFADILKLIVAGISAGLTIQAIQTYKEIREKRLIHSKVLLDNNLKYRTKTDIFFEHDNTLNLKVKTKYSLGKQEDELELSLPLSERRYSKEVDAHLESGYFKDVWEHGTERDKLINEHNAMAKGFLKDIIERIISEIEKTNPSLIEWDGMRQPPVKYFQPRNISYSVCYVSHGFYEQMFDLDKYYVIKPESDKWILATEYALAASDNQNEMQEIKQIIITTLNDVLAGEIFKALKRYYQDIKEKHDLYVNGISERIKEVENGIPLKGSCRFCPSILI